MPLISGPWPIPCALCEGFSRIKVICTSCEQYFHDACFENHECEGEENAENRKGAGSGSDDALS